MFCTVLTNLLENDSLNVPGFCENLKIAPGFQLFVTLRTQKSVNASHNSGYSLLEKYLYTINFLPLNELSEIICKNFPKLSTVSKRIVDVFLTFSSGCHSINDEVSDFNQILKENGGSEKKLEILPSSNKVSLSSLPNSGRMVSTRDLLKLCCRSNPSFSVYTNSECAYFVFQNCVDLFCSHLSQGKLKTDLIVSIGAKLGIIESRCVLLANEYKPKVAMALKAKNTWILLDELNLAPQSVLEGLNAILYHRGEVFIPELNKTFKLGEKTRMFAAQNPLRPLRWPQSSPSVFLESFHKSLSEKILLVAGKNG
jgi:midasin (ATPase involved in ribosome maturation)